ncbi:MAG TPA: sensor histidine kinase [Thermoanaerobaculia bacterium]|nr:sensor histidine kinase [Thermoanaerobaculia bacterium]
MARWPSAATLRWWVGVLCTFLGSFIVVVPQEFMSAPYRAMQGRHASWGLAIALSGLAMLAAAVLPRRRLVRLLAHLSAATVLSLLAIGFIAVAGWSGALMYGVLAAGLLVSAQLPAAPEPGLRHHRRGDLLSLLMACAGLLLGGGMVFLRPLFSSPVYELTDAQSQGAGLMLLVTAIPLGVVQLLPDLPRGVTRVVHLAAGLAYVAVCLVLAVPIRAWTGVVLYGVGGVLIAVLPWLRLGLRNFDPGSLRSRFAVALGAATTISLIATVALIAAENEERTTATLLEASRQQAQSTAHNVVDYFELIQARNTVLAADAARRPWEPEAQRRLLEAADGEYPRIAALGIFASDGSTLVRTGRRTLYRPWVAGLQAAMTAGDEPETVVQVAESEEGKLLLVGSPIFEDEVAVGLMVTGYDAGWTLRRLSQQGLVVRLVDAEGRVVAEQAEAQGRSVGLQTAVARTPLEGPGWEVVVDRSESTAQAQVRRDRLMLFALLVVMVVLSILAGMVAARVLARPLLRLAAAADQLAAGNARVPLATTGISEVDRLSSNFRDMRDRLAARTRESELLAGELRQRADALAEADRRKDEFLAMLAHELRNPLGAVSNAGYLLGQLGAEDPRLARPTGVIQRQIRHLTRMVDDLLDVSRITRGKVELQRTPVDLAAVAERAAETAAPLMESRRHELTLTLPSEPLPLRADATRLEQVIGNLLRNAAKYTEPGGHIALELRRDGGEAVVVVRDDGIGMSPELLPRIFELFAQGEQSLDRAGGGLGIGLTLVRQLVELHDGSVVARSDGPGRGSELEVRLPLADADVAPPPVQAVAE